jgi:hypothetical protein
MIHVNGVPPPAAPRPVDPAAPITSGVEKVEPPGVSDVVEISDVARLAAKLHEIPPVRTELIERVKAELVAGTYETHERLEITVERLMEELFPQG